MMKEKLKTIPMPLRYVINFLLIAVFMAVMSMLLSSGVITKYYSKIIMLVGINIILAVSLNVATGYLGQLPLGHAGFMAVGAYASAIFTSRTGFTNAAGFWVSLLVAGIVAGIFGIIIGIPALRLKGDYLAIITLGFGEIIRVILLNLDSLLGFDFTYGASGLKGIYKGTNFTTVFVCVVITCFIIHNMMKSRHGRAILSIRENEIAAEACGVNTTYYKTMAFTVSAFFAGVAGGLYSGYIGILKPDTFDFMKSIEILVMVVLGGMGSMLGSVVSATVLTLLPELLRGFSDYRMVAYSLVLVIVMIFKPSGMMGTYDFSMSRLLEKLINLPAKLKSSSGKKKEGSSK